MSSSIQYTYLHWEGGGELNQREGERGNSPESWVENTNWLYLQSVNSDKHMPQSPFIDNFLKWRHFGVY